MTFWRYLLQGSDELYLPKDWLEGPRVREYTRYTMRQLQQGAVISDVATMRRRAFWEAQAAKKHQPANVARFERKGAR